MQAAAHLLIRCPQANCWVQYLLFNVVEGNAELDAILGVCNGTLCPVQEHSNKIACMQSAAFCKASTFKATSQSLKHSWVQFEKRMPHVGAAIIMFNDNGSCLLHQRCKYAGENELWQCRP